MFERVLIVGLGSMGRRHARVVRARFPGVRITVLRRTGSPPCEPALADETFTTLDDALRSDPQAAVIANPASHHLEIALPLAQAGVHLLVEKPMSVAANGVERFIDVCAARGVTLMVGYNLRFAESLRRFRGLIHEQRIGRPLSARAEAGQHLSLWRPGTDYRESVSARASLGGGVLLELSHEIDYLRWLFGDVEWVSATLIKQSQLAIDVEDTAHVALGFAGAGHPPPVVATLSMDFVRHDRVRLCTVIGDRGSLRWDGVAGTVEVFDPGGSTWANCFGRPSAPDDSYAAEWDHFAECVRNGRTPLVSGDDGLAVLRIIDAARRSSTERAVATVGNVETSPAR